MQDFLHKLGSELDPARSDVIFSQEAMRRMMAFRWPGNVRQLENMIERMLILTSGRPQIDIEDLPPELNGDQAEIGNARPCCRKPDST